jgi:Na+/H+-dicarboxylate symporter
MLKKTPILLVAIILVLIAINGFLPYELKQFLYAFSLTIKSVIVFALPFIIFGLLFKTSVSLSKNATKLIGIILLMVCSSNFLTTWLSHYVGSWIFGFDFSLIIPAQENQFLPLWEFALPKLIANDKAMFAGIILGILASKFKKEVAENLAQKFDFYISAFLKYVIFFIPFFVTGFIVKLLEENYLNLVIKDYGAILAVIIISQICYVGCYYLAVSNGSLLRAFARIKNMIPAAICGFSSMSSAASMPLMIMGVEKNAKNKDLAKSVVPVTVNIHLMGDCIAIPILSYGVMKSFGMNEPSLLSYLIFTLYFVMAKFSVAAIPGGGIIVMLPILENYLGFNSDMMSLITALYILFDPIITTANVLGNGAFALLVDQTVKAETPGKTLPSSHSKNAPPAVET